MKKTFNLVLFSTFASIILLLSLIPNIGYITIIPGLSAVTIIHIPVLIGIIFLPFYYSLGLGLTFGISSFIAAFLYAKEPFDFVFQNPLIAIIPRVLFALVAYLIVRGLGRLKAYKYGLLLNIIVTLIVTSAFIGFGSYALINLTGWPSLVVYLLALLVIALILFLFIKYINKRDPKLAYLPTTFISATLIHSILVLSFVALLKVSALGEGSILKTFMFALGTNGIVEALLALFVGTPIVLALFNLKEESR
ncbi:MAG: hypothetical protein RBS76_02000 [Acholeplasmatales bacterium]|jgi:uncharacterized membrane protein|nr:hypothetical protein [Acholeplasmataceae bacterium]MCK9289480.1 hypothetical protein [Acholeplasmataceae bacterium]MDY0115254.1 hypothetical protein [Acholeplasmatales bacterium]